jgi:hypothetical protein
MNIKILDELTDDLNVQIEIDGVKHIVKSICNANICLNDGTELRDYSLNYQIADKWKELIPNYVELKYEPKVEFNRDKLILGLRHYKHFIYKTRVDSFVRTILNKQWDDNIIRSSYNPRDNDYCDSTYTFNANIEDYSIYKRFVEFLKENNLYESETQTTIRINQGNLFSQKVDEKLLFEDSIQTIINWIKRKNHRTWELSDTQLQLFEKLKETCVWTDTFINWHTNKFYEGATIDNLRTMGFKDFYEKFKSNYQKKRQYLLIK